MYLVTVEDDELGIWFDEPNAFDTLGEALVDAKKKLPPAGYSVVIYSCHELADAQTASLRGDE